MGMGSYDPTELVKHLDHVRAHHKDRRKEDYIFDVVLNEIGDGCGNLNSNVQRILPYLPGGSKATFNNVFVGSHSTSWTGAGSVYRELFARTQHGLVAEDPAVIAARENWYQSHGVPIGASWELRYWMQNHTEL